MVRTVRDFIFSGGLDGKVFVDSRSRPYVFLEPPTDEGNVKMLYVYRSDKNRRSPILVPLLTILGNKEYDPNYVEQYDSPKRVVDQEFLRQVRLRGVGD